MARCHQWHNIPWDALVDCLEVLYYRNNPRPPHLQAKRCETEEERERQAKKIRHFAARFESAIADFAATERRKYDLDSILKRTTVYDDGCLSDVVDPDILWPGYQSVEFWRSRPRLPSSAGYEGGDVAGVVKALLNVNNMEAVLLLAHTGVGIQDLECRTTHIHGFGFSNLAYDCLKFYVFLNHLIASGDLERPERWNASWKTEVYWATTSWDYGDEHTRVLKSFMTANRKGFVDYSRLHEVLSYCFRIMYQHHMVAMEIHGQACPDRLLHPLHSLLSDLRFENFGEPYW